jgi:hypothetical protein
MKNRVVAMPMKADPKMAVARAACLSPLLVLAMPIFAVAAAAEDRPAIWATVPDAAPIDDSVVVTVPDVLETPDEQSQGAVQSSE